MVLVKFYVSWTSTQYSNSIIKWSPIIKFKKILYNLVPVQIVPVQIVSS